MAIHKSITFYSTAIIPLLIIFLGLTASIFFVDQRQDLRDHASPPLSSSAGLEAFDFFPSHEGLTEEKSNHEVWGHYGCRFDSNCLAGQTKYFYGFLVKCEDNNAPDRCHYTPDRFVNGSGYNYTLNQGNPKLSWHYAISDQACGTYQYDICSVSGPSDQNICQNPVWGYIFTRPCDEDNITPTPTSTNTPSPTSTPTLIPTLTPTTAPTLIPTPTPTIISTPTPTFPINRPPPKIITPRPIITLTPTSTPTPTNTLTPTPTQQLFTIDCRCH